LKAFDHKPSHPGVYAKKKSEKHMTVYTDHLIKVPDPSKL